MGDRPEGSGHQRALGAALVVIAIASAVAAAGGGLFHSTSAFPELPGVTSSERAEPATMPPPGGAGVNLPWLVALLWSVAILASAWVLWKLWRDTPKPNTVVQVDVGPPSAQQLRAIVAEHAGMGRRLIDEGIDPREVVIACYAQMERSAAAAGATRRAHETEGEVVARFLHSLAIPAADVERLLQLYQAVKYGDVAASDAMRDKARDSLAAVEGALGVRG